MYREVSDRTLLGPFQATAVYWSGFITKFSNFFIWKLEKFYILGKLYIGQLQCNSHSVFRPTHKTTVYPAQCSVSVTPSAGTWRQLNIFIDVLCPAYHSWLLTAALLWRWKLTRPALCFICAGLDRHGATDWGETFRYFSSCGRFKAIFQLTHRFYHFKETYLYRHRREHPQLHLQFLRRRPMVIQMRRFLCLEVNVNWLFCIMQHFVQYWWLACDEVVRVKNFETIYKKLFRLYRSLFFL